MALIPGVSRSGGTITVGRALGYTRESAVRLSFLMAIPAVFGSGLLEAVKAVKNAGTDRMFPGWIPTIIAMIISFLLGYIGTVTSREPAAEDRFTELEVRALTGAGAEQAAQH